MIANCDKNLNVFKYTDFPTQNRLIYTDFFINILRTQNTALGTVHCGGARGHLGFSTSCASIFKVLVSFLPYFYRI